MKCLYISFSSCCIYMLEVCPWYKQSGINFLGSQELLHLKGVASYHLKLITAGVIILN